MGKEHKEGVLEQRPRSGICDDPARKPEYHEELTTTADLAAAQQAPARKELSGSTEATSEEPPSRPFSTEEAARFRSRWGTIQTGFVDEPHLAHVYSFLPEFVGKSLKTVKSKWIFEKL